MKKQKQIDLLQDYHQRLVDSFWLIKAELDKAVEENRRLKEQVSEPWWWHDPATRAWIVSGACCCPVCKRDRKMVSDWLERLALADGRVGGSAGAMDPTGPPPESV